MGHHLKTHVGIKPCLEFYVQWQLESFGSYGGGCHCQA